MMVRTTETENSSGGGNIMVQKAPKARPVVATLVQTWQQQWPTKK